MGQCRARHDEGTAGVDAQYAAPQIDLDFPYPGARLQVAGLEHLRSERGVVDQHMKSAEALDGRPDRLGGVVFARHIAVARDDRRGTCDIPGLAGRLVEHVGVALDHGDARPGAQQAERHRTSQTTPGTGHDRDLAVENPFRHRFHPSSISSDMTDDGATDSRCPYQTAALMGRYWLGSPISLC